MDRLAALGAFVQAAEAGSFVAAGRQLGMSSSAVGKAVARLEDQLGVRLFHRSTRSMTLTTEGALFLERWHRALLDEAKRNDDEALQSLAREAATWDGRASVGSTSYRLVRAWRLAVIERLQNGLLAPAQVALGDDFVMPDLPQMESVAWPLLQQRPAHLLPRKFSSWDALLADAAQQVRDQIRGPAGARTWGSRNTAAIRCMHAAGYDALSSVELTIDLGRRAPDWRDGLDFQGLDFRH